MGIEEGIFHRPVLLEEVSESLGLKPGGIYVDGTVGGGGHAAEILRRIRPAGLLIGIDRDDRALEESRKRLKLIGGRHVLIKGNYSGLGEILAGLGVKRVDGILLDLGVSSFQLDEASRGFSFMKDGLLDMRFDRTQGPTAREIVNGYSVPALSEIIRTYGEESSAGRIAQAIEARRKKAPITGTRELAELISEALPGYRKGRIHRATKTFQALRIAVNEELTHLSGFIPRGIEVLNKGGRLSIISFHSLEDRMVKERFNAAAGACTCLPGAPYCICLRKREIKVLTKKPIRPGHNELAANPRSRSARLRTAERI